MGYPTQSAHVGQAYSVGSANPGNVAGEAPLARQKSIYSLTLEEFQNTLGEPSRSFGSMNMEELLKNIWTAEESQAMVAAMGNAEGSEGGIVKQASLQRQGSYSIRGPLGRKTVDEVWKSVFQQGNSGMSESGQPPKQRELTFGEITLEDFLMKAGAVKEEDSRPNAGQSPFSFGGIAGPNKSGGNGFEGGFLSRPSVFPPSRTLLSSMPVNQAPTSLQNAYPNGSIQHHGQPFGQPLVTEVGAVFPNSLKSASTDSLAAAPIGFGGLSSPVGGGIAASLNANVNYGFNNGLSLTVPAFKADSPLSHSSDGTGTSQGNMPLSPLMQSDLNGSFFSRKRLAEGPAEMAVERRQRRMIKNRESAARSRARKQAYTVELENELTQLREENSKLKQKQETAEKKFKQVIATSQENRKEERKLRRTNTVPCCKAGRLPFVIARLPSLS